MIIYGTLKECTDKLFGMIDFRHGNFPDFDFAADSDEGYKNADDAYERANGWFGVKNLSKNFDCDTISLMFAHYGGGGIESMELNDREGDKEAFMKKIGMSADDVGYTLNPYEYTVFEIL